MSHLGDYGKWIFQKDFFFKGQERQQIKFLKIGFGVN